MEHNTNQNSNYLALLNLTDDGTYTVTKIEIIGSDKFVYIESKRQIICWIENHLKKIDNYIEN